MISIESLAKQLNINSEQLLSESINLYLNQNLYRIQSEMYLIQKKFDILDIFDFNSKVKEGKIHEAESLEDFFKLDHLTIEKEKYESLISQING